MKKSFIILLLLLPGMPMWFAACKPGKDNPAPKPELPPVTQEGKNTIGCLVNGEVFASDKFGTGLGCFYYYQSSKPNLYGTFEIRCEINKNSGDEKFISMYIEDEVFDTGHYSLQPKYRNLDLLRRGYFDFGSFDKAFICKENMYGYIHISYLDTIQHIIAGVFEFDGVNENNNKDTIRIRQGRFDAKFIY